MAISIVAAATLPFPRLGEGRVAAAAKTFFPKALEIPEAFVTIGVQGLVDPKYLIAGFTFLLPSSREDGPIEVRNFHRNRKVYLQT